jgi:hypothetical protein
MTIQTRERRAFIGAANWLHTARGKPAWKYVSDAFAVLLLYLAFSGIFMIKGRLGLKWRGTILISIGIAVPVLYVALAGGPASEGGKKPAATATATPTPTPPTVPPPTAPTTALTPSPASSGSAVLVPLPPDDN